MLRFFPVYWRFIGKTFLKIFAICTLCTFSLGIVIYNGQFASFIAAGANVSQVLMLAACSLFRIFSLIIGLTTLISAFLTIYQLSSSSEIITLRTSGLSLTRILAPLYYITAFITIGNFLSANLLAPYLRRKEAEVIASNQTINPLILLRKEAIPHMDKIHVEMELTEGGMSAKDLLVAFHNREKTHLTLFIADNVVHDGSKLQGEAGSLITHLTHENEGFDHLFITNQKHFTFTNHTLTPLLSSSHKSREATVKSVPSADLITTSSFDARKELLERGCTTLIPLTFSLLGISLGLFHPKQLEERRWYLLIGCIIVFFSAFFQAGQMKHSLPLIAALYYIPHLFLIGGALTLQAIYQKGHS